MQIAGAKNHIQVIVVPRRKPPAKDLSLAEEQQQLQSSEADKFVSHLYQETGGQGANSFQYIPRAFSAAS